MVAAWVRREMGPVDLRDRRLNERLQIVLDQLAAQPAASIPAATGGHAEMAAAYRLFDNPKVTFERVLGPHREATLRRCAAQASVVLVQDTTEIDLTRPTTRVRGDGPLDNGPRRGLLLHEMQAFTEDGTPLGTLRATCWARRKPRLGSSDAAHKIRQQTPIERKESRRWVRGLALTRAIAQQFAAQQVATRLVAVADSEADIYEWLVEAAAGPADYDWIIRAAQDRALADASDDSGRLMRARLSRQKALYGATVEVRARRSRFGQPRGPRKQSRAARQAAIEVRAATLTLRPPWRPGRRLPEVTVNAVLASEVDPPAEEPPVEWLLLTNLPIDTPSSVGRVLQLYQVRWGIELFFRTLKSGCRIEERRFEAVRRLRPALAVYLIVAWRTLFVCGLGRRQPEADCEAVFEPAEWRAVYAVVRRRAPPRTPPRLGEIVRLIGQLGGCLSRTRAGPGPQAIWLGLQRAHDLALAWHTFGPADRKRDV